MMMLKALLIFSILFISIVASAAGAVDGVPTKMVLLQAFNVGLFALLLFFLLRKKISAHFAEREEQFFAAKKKAEELLAKAQTEKEAIEAKFEELKRSSQQTIDQAKTDAAALKKDMLAEAETISEKIKSEAKKSASNEVARASEELRKDFLQQSIDQTRSAISSDLSEDDQKRLHGEFVNKAGAARSGAVN